MRLSLSLFMMSMAVSSVQAETYRNDELKFQMEVPAGWSTMPASELAQINQMAQQAAAGSGQTINYVAGFRLRRADPTAPYVLVQRVDSMPRGGTFDEIEDELNRTLPGAVKSFQKKIPDLVSDMKIGQATLDREKARLIVRMSMGAPGGGHLDCLSITNLGSKKGVGLHCYANPAEFKTLQPHFLALADTFKFDPGHEFKEGAASSMGGGILKGSIAGAVIGGVVGLVVWLVRKMTGSSRE